MSCHGMPFQAWLLASTSPAHYALPILHVPVPAQCLQSAPILRILGRPRSFGNVGELAGAKLIDDVCGTAGGGFDGASTRGTPQRPIAPAFPLIVVHRHCGDLLPVDIFPDVQLRPIEQRVDPDVGARGEICLELVPEFGRLVAYVPVVVYRAWREVALLGPAALLIRPGPSAHRRHPPRR